MLAAAAADVAEQAQKHAILKSDAVRSQQNLSILCVLLFKFYNVDGSLSRAHFVEIPSVL